MNTTEKLIKLPAPENTREPLGDCFVPENALKFLTDSEVSAQVLLIHHGDIKVTRRRHIENGWRTFFPRIMVHTETEPKRRTVIRILGAPQTEPRHSADLRKQVAEMDLWMKQEEDKKEDKTMAARERRRKKK